MATEQELISALQKADAAGNAEDAKAFADAIRSMRAQSPQAPQAAPQAPQGPSMMDRVQMAVPEAQTLLRAGQGVYQTMANIPSLTGLIDPAIAEEKGNIATRTNQAIAGQNEQYAGAKQRVVGASDYPVATEAMINAREMGTGNMLNPMGLVGSGLPNAALRGAASASGFAASQPVTDPNANFWLEKAKQQAVAVPMGAAMGAISAPPRETLPTTKQLKAQGKAAYEQVAADPVPVTPEMLSAVQDRAGRTAIKNAVNDARINRETALADEMNALLSDDPAQIPTQISANAADKLSQSFRDLGSQAMRADRGNASRGWFGRRGDVEQALTSVPEVKSARRIWSQYEKSKLVDETIQAAQDSHTTPGGTADLNQALRREFGKVVRNDEAMASFSEAERDAIKRVANGTFTANVLQRLGKFSPVKNHLSAIVDMGLAAGGHAAAGGIEGALPAFALAGIGEGARQGGIAATSRNAAIASELMRRGSAPQPPVPGPTPNVPVGNLPSALLIDALMRPQRAY